MRTARVTGLLNTCPAAMVHPLGDSLPPKTFGNPVQTDPIMTHCPDVQLPLSKAVFSKFIEAKRSPPFPECLSRSFFTSVYMGLLTQDSRSTPNLQRQGNSDRVWCGETTMSHTRLWNLCHFRATMSTATPKTEHDNLRRVTETDIEWFRSHGKHSSKDRETVTLACSLNLREVVVFICYFGLFHSGLLCSL